MPPDSPAKSASASSCMRETTCSTCCSSCQPSAASSACWACARRSSAACEPSEARASLVAWYSLTSSAISPTPSATTSKIRPRSVRGTSCSRRAMRAPRCTTRSPSSAAKLPSMIFNKVDLPSPLRPIRHTRSPASMDSETPSSNDGWVKESWISRTDSRAMG